MACGRYQKTPQKPLLQLPCSPFLFIGGPKSTFVCQGLKRPRWLIAQRLVRTTAGLVACILCHWTDNIPAQYQESHPAWNTSTRRLPGFQIPYGVSNSRHNLRAGVQEYDEATRMYELERHTLFYSDEGARELYKEHVQKILQRRNTLSGLKYKEDPIIRQE